MFNVGTGEDVTIRELARDGVRAWSASRASSCSMRRKPDGTPRKLLDVSKLGQMGWTASIPLEEGIRATYADFLQHHAALSQTAVAV